MPFFIEMVLVSTKEIATTTNANATATLSVRVVILTFKRVLEVNYVQRIYFN